MVAAVRIANRSEVASGVYTFSAIKDQNGNRIYIGIPPDGTKRWELGRNALGETVLKGPLGSLYRVPNDILQKNRADQRRQIDDIRAWAVRAQDGMKDFYVPARELTPRSGDIRSGLRRHLNQITGSGMGTRQDTSLDTLRQGANFALQQARLPRLQELAKIPFNDPRRMQADKVLGRFLYEKHLYGASILLEGGNRRPIGHWTDLLHSQELDSFITNMGKALLPEAVRVSGIESGSKKPLPGAGHKIYAIQKQFDTYFNYRWPKAAQPLRDAISALNSYVVHQDVDRFRQELTQMGALGITLSVGVKLIQTWNPVSWASGLGDLDRAIQKSNSTQPLEQAIKGLGYQFVEVGGVGIDLVKLFLKGDIKGAGQLLGTKYDLNTVEGQNKAVDAVNTLLAVYSGARLTQAGFKKLGLFKKTGSSIVPTKSGTIVSKSGNVPANIAAPNIAKIQDFLDDLGKSPTPSTAVDTLKNFHRQITAYLKQSSHLRGTADYQRAARLASRIDQRLHGSLAAPSSGPMPRRPLNINTDPPGKLVTKGKGVNNTIANPIRHPITPTTSMPVIEPRYTSAQLAQNARVNIVQTTFNDPGLRQQLQDRLLEQIGDKPTELYQLQQDRVRLSQIAEPIAKERLQTILFQGSGVPAPIQNRFFELAARSAQESKQPPHRQYESLAQAGSSERRSLLLTAVAQIMVGVNVTDLSSERNKLYRTLLQQLGHQDETFLKNLVVPGKDQPYSAAYVDTLRKAIVQMWSQDENLSDVRQLELDKRLTERYLKGKNTAEQIKALLDLLTSPRVKKTLTSPTPLSLPSSRLPEGIDAIVSNPDGSRRGLIKTEDDARIGVPVQPRPNGKYYVRIGSKVPDFQRIAVPMEKYKDLSGKPVYGESFGPVLEVPAPASEKPIFPFQVLAESAEKFRNSGYDFRIGVGFKTGLQVPGTDWGFFKILGPLGEFIRNGIDVMAPGWAASFDKLISLENIQLGNLSSGSIVVGADSLKTVPNNSVRFGIGLRGPEVFAQGPSWQRYELPASKSSGLQIKVSQLSDEVLKSFVGKDSFIVFQPEIGTEKVLDDRLQISGKLELNVLPIEPDKILQDVFGVAIRPKTKYFVLQHDLTLNKAMLENYIRLFPIPVNGFPIRFTGERRHETLGKVSIEKGAVLPQEFVAIVNRTLGNVTAVVNVPVRNADKLRFSAGQLSNELLPKSKEQAQRQRVPYDPEKLFVTYHSSGAIRISSVPGARLFDRRGNIAQDIQNIDFMFYENGFFDRLWQKIGLNVYLPQSIPGVSSLFTHVYPYGNDGKLRFKLVPGLNALKWGIGNFEVSFFGVREGRKLSPAVLDPKLTTLTFKQAQFQPSGRPGEMIERWVDASIQVPGWMGHLFASDINTLPVGARESIRGFLDQQKQWASPKQLEAINYFEGNYFSVFKDKAPLKMTVRDALKDLLRVLALPNTGKGSAYDRELNKLLRRQPEPKFEWYLQAP